MNYLCFDAGTTCCKAQLFSEDGEILAYRVAEYEFLSAAGEKYVDTEAIWQHLCAVLADIGSGHVIDSVCISSLGESFVLLDKEDAILFHPMLYTDPRGEAQAKEIADTVGLERACYLCGVAPHSMYSLSKLLWIKQERPDLYRRAERVMLVGEYLGYRLSGVRCIDYGLAARTGAFDIRHLQFSEEMLAACGIRADLFSTPARAGSVVAPLRADLVKKLGLRNTPVLVLGSHDQICAALGAGACRAGDAVDGMGTVECLTALFPEPPAGPELAKMGYPCVPYPLGGLYATYILNYSCGSTVNWYRKTVMHDYAGEEGGFFPYMEKHMGEEPSGLLFLPYLDGASTPYQDLAARGVAVGLSTDTKDSDLYRSILEGTAMEMRLNMETVAPHGITVRRAVATGGGANSPAWLQIKADIEEIPYRVLRSSEGGLCGCALLSAMALDKTATEEELRARFVRYASSYTPQNTDRYTPYYHKYKTLYQTVKEMFV